MHPCLEICDVSTSGVLTYSNLDKTTTCTRIVIELVPHPSCALPSPVIRCDSAVFMAPKKTVKSKLLVEANVLLLQSKFNMGNARTRVIKYQHISDLLDTFKENEYPNTAVKRVLLRTIHSNGNPDYTLYQLNNWLKGRRRTKLQIQLTETPSRPLTLSDIVLEEPPKSLQAAGEVENLGSTRPAKVAQPRWKTALDELLENHAETHPAMEIDKRLIARWMKLAKAPSEDEVADYLGKDPRTTLAPSRSPTPKSMPDHEETCSPVARQATPESIHLATPASPAPASPAPANSPHQLAFSAFVRSTYAGAVARGPFASLVEFDAALAAIQARSATLGTACTAEPSSSA